jgi:hypothetical protein|tara:strand:- start:287 stop:529 length:243 start_codon:yes stop_codon:yes gene_type:complete
MDEEYKRKIDEIFKRVNEIDHKTPELSLMTENDVVKLLGVTKVTLNSWRKSNVLIKHKHYIRIGRSIRYKREELINYKNN